MERERVTQPTNLRKSREVAASRGEFGQRDAAR
jgi:hypothetical protein